MNYDSKEDKILLAIIALLSVILIYLIVWTFKYNNTDLSASNENDNNVVASSTFGNATSTTAAQASPAIIAESTTTTTEAATEIMPDASSTVLSTTTSKDPVDVYEYIEITEGCGVHFSGECLNVRSGPGTNYAAVYKLRTGVVLKTSKKVTDGDGRDWYKITFDEWIRYPERMGGDWYVAADYVRPFMDQGVQTLAKGDSPTTTKKIIVFSEAIRHFPTRPAELLRRGFGKYVFA
jgi:hypothetical protein